jgi:hypothetical protein
MADMQELEYRIARLETELLKTNDRHNELLKMIAESQQEASDNITIYEDDGGDPADLEPACPSITDQQEGGTELKCPTKEGA